MRRHCSKANRTHESEVGAPAPATDQEHHTRLRVCRFAIHQATNPAPTHRCWLINATTLTKRTQKDTQLVTVTGTHARFLGSSKLSTLS